MAWMNNHMQFRVGHFIHALTSIVAQLKVSRSWVLNLFTYVYHAAQYPSTSMVASSQAVGHDRSRVHPTCIFEFLIMSSPYLFNVLALFCNVILM